MFVLKPEAKTVCLLPYLSGNNMETIVCEAPNGLYGDLMGCHADIYVD